MVEQVGAQVCVCVVLSSTSTSDQVTPVEFSSVATNPARTKIEISGWGLCPVRKTIRLV
jgi:hypothetical protein